ncbi:hypothetical protein HU200_021469 [Digitaria exilis]|uniref:Uncharacterized protein n=1 Tax=Digitaria exilis TaxID=1010633 RepID=A0A835EZ59_9POAL|nr:hypothetical protein HU200_021469 [Digitaria exilis]
MARQRISPSDHKKCAAEIDPDHRFVSFAGPPCSGAQTGRPAAAAAEGSSSSLRVGQGRGSEMPHRARPMTGLLLFMGVNLVLVNTISLVYDFVCFHPYWERRVLLASLFLLLHLPKALHGNAWWRSFNCLHLLIAQIKPPAQPPSICSLSLHLTDARDPAVSKLDSNRVRCAAAFTFLARTPRLPFPPHIMRRRIQNRPPPPTGARRNKPSATDTVLHLIPRRETHLMRLFSSPFRRRPPPIEFAGAELQEPPLPEIRSDPRQRRKMGATVTISSPSDIDFSGQRRLLLTGAPPPPGAPRRRPLSPIVAAPGENTHDPPNRRKADEQSPVRDGSELLRFCD